MRVRIMCLCLLHRPLILLSFPRTQVSAKYTQRKILREKYIDRFYLSYKVNLATVGKYANGPICSLITGSRIWHSFQLHNQLSRLDYYTS